MVAWLLLWTVLGWAGEHRVVRQGDTIESIADETGWSGRESEIRSLNGLGIGAQPEVGRVLLFPEVSGEHSAHEAAILSFRGQVEARIHGRSRPAKVGMHLPIGTTVCTGVDGFATIRLAVSVSGEHDDMTLFPGTCLSIDGTSAGRGARHSLVGVETGSVSVRPTEDAGTVTVVTPSGVTSGEQGGFRVTIEDDASRTEALSADARVFGAAEEVIVQSGHGSRVEAGQAPSDPVRLLDPGSLIRPDDGDGLFRPDFQWAPVDRALGYRLELAVASDFSDVVRVEDVPKNAWMPDRLFLPYRVPGLWWRVSAIDRTGFVGAPSEVRALVIPEGLGP